MPYKDPVCSIRVAGSCYVLSACMPSWMKSVNECSKLSISSPVQLTYSCQSQLVGVHSDIIRIEWGLGRGGGRSRVDGGGGMGASQFALKQLLGLTTIAVTCLVICLQMYHCTQEEDQKNQERRHKLRHVSSPRLCPSFPCTLLWSGWRT